MIKCFVGKDLPCFYIQAGKRLEAEIADLRTCLRNNSILNNLFSGCLNTPD